MKTSSLAGEPKRPPANSRLVNDTHSRLNATTVKQLHRPESLIQLISMVRNAMSNGSSISMAGFRHAMGGQQFLQNGAHLDMTSLNRVIAFDRDSGTITVEAGIGWPDLFQELERLQPDDFCWTFRQKQSGADRLSIGGALSANIHGRGLQLPPLVQDIVSFDMINAQGCLQRCSRDENRELFGLAIGGYGLFGIVYAVTLQLVPRHKLVREVAIIDADELMSGFDRRIASKFTYGDFQFSIDPRSAGFLKRGIFSCYRPVSAETPISANQARLSPARWEHLLHLAHMDKAKVWKEYSTFYLSTQGQVYWSDLHQFSHYSEEYHRQIDQQLGSACPHSEMITEIYVPRNALSSFLQAARDAGRKQAWNVIYGTIRLIERDTESFLAWAREPWACLIFNLCVEHSAAGLAHARTAFRTLIDRAIEHGGSYYLTYHKWASVAQLTACHPRIHDFFALKRQYDPLELFSSNWFRFYSQTLAEE